MVDINTCHVVVIVQPSGHEKKFEVTKFRGDFLSPKLKLKLLL